MSTQKYDINKEFPFNELSLANPSGLQGGSYFSKLKIFDEKVLVQMPKCSTKNGIHRTGKKIYIDLKFNTENQQFVEWVNTFSDKIKNLIYEKKDYWFQNEMSLDDIEYHWQEILRNYKKNNLLLRCIIKKPKNINHKELVMIYDEDEVELPIDAIKPDSLLIPLVEITGLKFTSQSFLVEFALRQIMILNDITEGNKKLISFNKTTSMTTASTINVATTTAANDDDVATTTAANDDDVDTATAANDDDVDTATAANDDDVDLEESKENVSLSIKEEVNNDINDIKENMGKDNNNLGIIVQQKELVDITDIIDIKSENKSTEETNLEEKKLEKSDVDRPSALVKNAINEVNLEYPSADLNEITLKKPEEVYIAIYKEARRKAKEAKNTAIAAYLEMKRIKNRYLLGEIDSSDDELKMPIST